jgi:hypothetical protein
MTQPTHHKKDDHKKLILINLSGWDMCQIKELSNKPIMWQKVLN